MRLFANALWYYELLINWLLCVMEMIVDPNGRCAVVVFVAFVTFSLYTNQLVNRSAEQQTRRDRSLFVLENGQFVFSLYFVWVLPKEWVTTINREKHWSKAWLAETEKAADRECKGIYYSGFESDTAAVISHGKSFVSRMMWHNRCDDCWVSTRHLDFLESKHD